MREISAALAEESITLVSEGFRGQKDPYGGRWKGRKSGGGSALLVQTGALRSSFHTSSVSASGFTISSGVAYSVFHQSGTKSMPARMMLPKENDVPGPWEQAFDEVAEEVLEDHFGE